MENSKRSLLFLSSQSVGYKTEQYFHNAAMASELWQRIKAARKHANLTQQDIADKFGVTRSAVAQWESSDPAKRTRPRFEMLLKISETTGCPFNWLLSDESELNETWKTEVLIPEESEITPEELKLARKILNEFVLVPRFDVEASMGPGSHVHSEQVVDYLSFKRSWVQNHLRVDPQNLVLIDSRGDSMEPTIFNGDLLLVDRTPITSLSNGIYVMNMDGNLLAKRIEYLFDASIKIISDNARYSTQILTKDQAANLSIIGRVVWIGRGI